MPLLVRTWNVFHGNAVPPERRAYLEEMVRLAASDAPDLLCLQEVPVWALAQLGEWSGMTVIGAVAARPRVVSAELGRLITELDHGLLRSALTGQANAILVAPHLRVLEQRTLVLNPRRLRRAVWERRVCQAVRIDGVGVAGNFHATSAPADDRIAAGQLLRAAAFVDALAFPGEPVILCGDANICPGHGSSYDELRSWGYSKPAPGIDQILVRGLPATAPFIWPDERRRVDGRLLSDHAPVELHLG
ncbi:MAG: endonuclease/exonuclease/phosphatase family protein [Gaiellaceae bacterium]